MGKVVIKENKVVVISIIKKYFNGTINPSYAHNDGNSQIDWKPMFENGIKERK